MSVPFPTSDTMPNLAKRQAFIWWIISCVLIVGIFLPFLLGGDAEQWGFGIAFLCIVFGITSVVVAVMYTKRARLVSRMLNNDNLLAHWKYDPVEWQRYAQKEHEENKREKKNMFLLISGISIFIGIILFISNPDGALIFLFTVLGIIVMMGCAAFLAVWIRYRQNQKYIGEVYISPDGVYLNRELHVWHGMGAALEEVKYQGEYRAQPILAITYSVPSRYNRQFVTVRVPVPRGAESKAVTVAESLQNQMKDKPASQSRKRRSNEVL